MAQMSMGQWRKRLGDAVALEDAPRQTGVSSMQVLRGVKTGKIPLHTFRAADGRVFRMVKTRDVEQYRAKAQSAAPAIPPEPAQPAITMDGMKAAFKEMADS